MTHIYRICSQVTLIVQLVTHAVFFLVNDLQTPPSPPQKEPFRFYDPNSLKTKKKFRYFFRVIVKIHQKFTIFVLSQLRICRPPPPLSFVPVLMKDTHCAESKEKFRFLFFELTAKFIEN